MAGLTENEIEARMFCITNPYALLLEMRHVGYQSMNAPENKLSLRQSLWVFLHGFRGQPSAPRSSPIFNENFDAYLQAAAPHDIPLPRLVNIAIPPNIVATFTEVNFLINNPVVVTTSIEGGWGNAIFTRVGDHGSRSLCVRGNNTERAKNFIRGVRRLANILHFLKIRGSRFIRVSRALRFFLPPPQGEEHSHASIYWCNTHLVRAEELWQNVIGAGDGDIKINLWRAELQDGDVLHFFQVD